MFKRVLFFTLLLQFYSTQAQQLLVGVKTGLAVNNTNSDVFTDKTNKYGISAGITFDYFFKNKLFIGTDLLYVQRGFGNYYYFGYFNGADPKTLTSPVYLGLEYISIPLKFGYSFGNRLSGFGNIAIIPSYLLFGSIYDETFSSNRTKDLNRKDLAGQIELGMGYFITKNFNLVISAAYYQSRTSISSPTFFSGYPILNYGAVLSIGLKYKVKG